MVIALLCCVISAARRSCPFIVGCIARPSGCSGERTFTTIGGRTYRKPHGRKVQPARARDGYLAMLIEPPDTFVMIISRSRRATSVLDGDCRDHLHDACNVDTSALVDCPRRHGVRDEGNAARRTALCAGFSLGSIPYPTDSVGQKSNRHSETAGHVMASVRLGDHVISGFSSRHLVLALHRGFLRAAGSLLSSWLFTSVLHSAASTVSHLL